MRVNQRRKPKLARPAVGKVRLSARRCKQNKKIVEHFKKNPEKGVNKILKILKCFLKQKDGEGNFRGWLVLLN